MTTPLRPLYLLALACAPLTPLLWPNAPLQKAYVDGAGWRALTLADFVNVNGTADT